MPRPIHWGWMKRQRAKRVQVRLMSWISVLILTSLPKIR